MIEERKRKFTGIGLIAVGTLFLFVTNHILIGWEHVWPLFPIGAGVALLRSYRARGSGNALVLGLLGVLLGAFLLLFSVGILDWTRMGVLWPTIPILVGASMLAGRFNEAERTSIVLEVGIIVFGVVAFTFTTETISPRVAAPFVRFWPLVLIVAGVVILKRHTGEPAGGASTVSHDPDMESVRAVIDAVDKVEPSSEPSEPPRQPAP